MYDEVMHKALPGTRTQLNLATGSRSIVSLKSDFCNAETCSAIAALVGKTDVTVR